MGTAALLLLQLLSLAQRTTRTPPAWGRWRRNSSVHSEAPRPLRRVSKPRAPRYPLGSRGCAPWRLTPDCVGQPAGGGEADRSTPRAQAGTRSTVAPGRPAGDQARPRTRTSPPRPRLLGPGPRPGPAPSRAALLRAPPAGGSESEAERLTSRRHRQTSPRVRRGKQPERRRRRRAAAGGGGRDRRGAGSSEPKATRSDSDGGDPVTAREVLSVTRLHHA